MARTTTALLRNQLSLAARQSSLIVFDCRTMRRCFIIYSLRHLLNRFVNDLIAAPAQQPRQPLDRRTDAGYLP
ncbi:MAG: hypothetical protein H0T92_16785 [Pyrinomonadaceae bacterium]|nr:hypothetical protein [Pyrinomonadaceae bacterium]